MNSPFSIDFAETRRLALDLLQRAEKIIALLNMHEQIAKRTAGTDSIKRLALIQTCAAAYFGYTREAMLAQDRRAPRVWARAVAAVVCREFTNCAGTAIEDAFRRSHGFLKNSQNIVAWRTTQPTAEGRRCAGDLANVRQQVRGVECDSVISLCPNPEIKTPQSALA
jgi:hypothetical protein